MPYNAGPSFWLLPGLEKVDRKAMESIFSKNATWVVSAVYSCIQRRLRDRSLAQRRGSATKTTVIGKDPSSDGVFRAASWFPHQ
jgi:hypothetical protein